MTLSVKSLMYILENLLRDLKISQSSDADPARDMCYIRERVKHEGISFLTITLPQFGKDFEKALETGCVSPSLFLGFKKSGVIPTLLSGILRRVFDRSTGVLLDTADPLDIHAIRQIVYFAKKIELPCSPERVDEAFRTYIETDEQIRDAWIGSHEEEVLCGVANFIWPIIISEVEEKINTFSLVPRHGPGAVAERYTPNGKYIWKRWHERLESFLPFTEYAVANLNNIEGDLRNVRFVSPEQEEPVRVISVPKTLKTPRIIAIEPTCMQFAQQALLYELYDVVDRHSLTKGVFNFRDQTVNQEQALLSSVTKDQATLDLSEASDRVSYQLVRKIFESCPIFWNALDSCRTRTARVPCKFGRETKTIVLKKFASMGSGVCFPIEAMVFYTIILSGIISHRKMPVTWDSVSTVSKSIFVFGDDIIVPSTEASTVIEWLEVFGLKVNQSKSFMKGNFRESCGLDAYRGVQVKPVYIRTVPPKNRRCGTEFLSWVSTANQMYLAGLWHTSQYMRQVVDYIHPLPYSTDDSQGCHWVSFVFKASDCHWHSGLSSFRQRTCIVKMQKFDDPVEGRSALFKCLTSLHGRSNALERSRPGMHHLETVDSEPEHLFYSVRRGAVTIKRHWAQVR